MLGVMARIFMCLGFVLYIWCNAYPANAAYPLAYVGQTEIYDISLSTDGSKVVLLKQGKRQKDWSKLEIKDAQTGQVLRVIQKDYRSVFWVNWIDDDLILAYSREYVEGKKRYYVSDKLIGISPSSGKIWTIYETDPVKAGKPVNKFRLIKVSMATEKVALKVDSKKSKSLIYASLYNDEVVKVAQGNSKTLYWLLDDNLKPYIRIDLGGKDYVRKYYQQSTSDRWKLFRTVNLLESTFKEIAIGKDGTEYLLMGRPEGADRVGLYKSVIGDDRAPEIVFEHNKYDLSSIKLATFNDKILYAAWWDDTFQRHWFDDKAKSIAQDLRSRLKPHENWFLVETSRDQKAWLIYVSSFENPGTYQIWSSESGTIHDLEKLRPGLSKATLSRREAIQYPSSDGTNIVAYFTPAKNGGVTAPVIVMPHGGPVARDKNDWDGWSQFFAYSGYSVFQPNFRGSGGYGRTFEELGHRQWAGSMQSDIEDGVEYLIRSGRINADSKRAIVGASYGGYAALTAAIQEPEKYSCVISVNGLSHIPKFLEQFDISDPVDLQTRDLWIKRIGDPETQLEHLNDISPALHTDKIESQIRLIHGTADQIVHIEQSKIMYESAKSNGVDISFKELTDIGHNGWSPKTSTDVLADMEWFLLDCMN